MAFAIFAQHARAINSISTSAPSGRLATPNSSSRWVGHGEMLAINSVQGREIENFGKEDVCLKDIAKAYSCRF
jgi:hypothetical protein